MFSLKRSSNPLILRLRRMNHRRIKARREERPRGPREFSVLGQMKNESLNIDEWIDHYLWQGARRVCIIDNGSTDDSVAKVRAWQANHPVELIELANKWDQPGNCWAGMRHFGLTDADDWIIVADMDEFWFSRNHATFRELLPKFDGLDLVYGVWTIFGANGDADHPASLRRDLRRCAPRLGPFGFRKWMIRGRALTDPGMVHIHFISGIDSSRVMADMEDLQINHYVIQSKRFWEEVKMSRGSSVNVKDENIRTWDMFHETDAMCTTHCDRLALMVEARDAEAGTPAQSGQNTRIDGTDTATTSTSSGSPMRQ